MMSAGPTRWRTWAHDADGRSNDGRPPCTAPSTRTPWDSSPKAATAAVVVTTPTRAPGNALIQARGSEDEHEHDRARPTDHPLVWPSWLAILVRRPIVVVPPPGNPRTAGS